VANRSSPDPRVAAIAAALVARGETLATVECSLAGGLANTLTDLAGASGWFVAGVAPYAATAKEVLLGLGLDAFGGHGAVSPEAAALLARAGRARLGADWTIAETGLLGPRGARRSAKEPGTAYLHLLGPGLDQGRAVSTGLDDRLANKRAICDAALGLLVEYISTNVEIA
jgi:PncC family amidohydrolase